MNSTNCIEFLKGSCDTQNCSEHPDTAKETDHGPMWLDTDLAAVILLSMVLLAIYAFAGGIVVVVIAACVLIIGFGFGIIWNRLFPYQVYSITKIQPIDNSSEWTSPKTHWMTQNNQRIFFDTALGGCYL